MPIDLRERFAEMASSGASFAELVGELDRYKDQLLARRYDELWLFCWVLAKRQVERSRSFRFTASR
jgi:hypothetical protein